MKRTTIALALLLSLTGCSSAEPSPDPAPAATEKADGEVSGDTEPTGGSETDGNPTGDNDGDVSTSAESPFVTGPSESADPLSIDAQTFPVASRVGVHEGYDRVVVEYEKPAADIGWSTEGVADSITSAGSGQPVDIDGTVFLQIRVAGLRYPTNDELELSWDPQIPADSIVSAVDVSYPFEGMHEVNIGLSAGSSYRVTVLDNPTRLVVDIQR